MLGLIIAAACLTSPCYSSSQVAAAMGQVAYDILSWSGGIFGPAELEGDWSQPKQRLDAPFYRAEVAKMDRLLRPLAKLERNSTSRIAIKRRSYLQALDEASATITVIERKCPRAAADAHVTLLYAVAHLSDGSHVSEHRKEVAALGRFCGDLAHEHSDLDAGFIVSPPRRPPPTPIPTPVPTMIPATPRPSFSPIAFTTKLHIAAPLRGLDLDVADTPYLWEQGFRGHAAPAPQTGIVFRYDDGKPHEFSMNDVAFALDIVTLDDNGFVRDVTTLQPHPASDPINEVADFFIPATQFIIALPAGEAVQDGLVPGSRMGDFSAYYRRMTRPI